MKITICGSMHFFDKIIALKKTLEELGHSVETPDREGLDTDYSKLSDQEQIDLKQKFIDGHIEKIKRSDAVIIANYPKNGRENYIGANSFLEMGIAYTLGKKIFLLHNIPDQENSVEIRGLKPSALGGDMSRLN